MNDIGNQLRSESLHFAFLAVMGGVSFATAIIGWLIRRDIRRSEKDAAERGLAFAVLQESFDDHKRRSGLEISDLKQRVGILAAQVKHDIPEVEIPQWPTR